MPDNDIDLTAAIDAAARAYFEENAPITSAQHPWDQLTSAAIHQFRENMLPAVVAAAPLIAEHVRAQVAEEIGRVMTDPSRVRPRATDAEFATDLANDWQWCQMIARGESA